MVAGNARLAIKLMGQGADVTMVGLNEILWNSDPQIPTGVNAVSLGAQSTKQMVRQLVNYIVIDKPDVLAVSGYLESLAAIVAQGVTRSKVKVIARTHEMTSSFFAAQPSRFDRRYMRYVLGLAFRHAHCITAPSESASADLADFLCLPDARVTTLPDPVLGPTGRASTTTQFIHPWFDQEDLTVIGSVGRLSQEKGFETLIEAFASYRTYNDKARLIIIGEGPERGRLQLLLRRLNMEPYAALPGYQKGLERAFKRMDVFVCSSAREGLNNALVEALSHGTAVVSTKCGGPEDVLSGTDAKLVPVGDAVSLRLALHASLSSRSDESARIERARRYHVDRVWPLFQSILP
jgi:glycosyltransferase involved in cell wall biosynthesis